MLYEDSLNLIQKTESIILVKQQDTYTINHSFLKIWEKNYNYPARIMLKGVKLLVYPLIINFVIFSPVILTINATYKTGEMGIMSCLFVGLICALIFTHFLPPSPSVHAEFGIVPEEIEKVMIEIDNNGFTIQQLAIIKENIQLFESNFNNKMRASKTCLIILWSGFVFWITQSHATLLKLPDSVMSVIPSVDNILLIVLFLLLIAIGHFLLKCYAVTTKKIFSTILYAINDRIAIIDENSCNLGL